MKEYHIIKFQYIFLIITLLFTYASNYTINKSDNINKANKRKMEEDTDTFLPLKIFLDLYNFNNTFPNSALESYKYIFYEALEKAKNALEKIIRINTDLTAEIKKYENQNMIDWGLDYWDSEFFEGNFNFETYNFFILFRFDNTINTIASSYIWDKYVGPTIGVVTLNEDLLKEKTLNLKYLTNLMLSQFIRLLGFSYYINDDEENWMINEDEDEDENKVYIEEDNFPGVFNYAKKYFGLEEIDKIYLEKDEYDNLYWPSRYFLGEIMSDLDYPEEKVLSIFTLAFLEDLHDEFQDYYYYKIDYKYTGGLMRFGKHKGDKFINKEIKCGSISGEGDEAYLFANEFYLPNEIPIYPESSCSSGRLNKTIYALHLVSTNGDEEKCEFKKNERYGLKETNYCPIAEFKNEESLDIYTGSCSDDTTQKDQYEITGKNSFCILSSLTDISKYKASCHRMFCSSESLTILVGDYYLVCPREGGRIKPEHFEGFLLCPDYNLICTGSILCNDLYDCIDNNSTEIENSFNYEYLIETTQNSSVYNNTPLKKNFSELTEDGICPKLCMQCDLGRKCIKCAPTFKVDNTGKCINKIENCISYNIEEECELCESDYTLVNNGIEKICLLTEDINNKKYYKDSNDIYHPCSDKYTHCPKCNAESCLECESGFILIQNIKNGPLSCIEDTNDNKKYYYQFLSSTDNYYIKCDIDFQDCSECSSNTICTKCKDNKEVIDDGIICGDLSTQKYYPDSTGKYKSCNKYSLNQNCEKCEIKDGNYWCLECEENFAFFYDNTDTNKCISKLDKDLNNYYIIDTFNYYPCNSYPTYHNVQNCKTCNKKEECNSCINSDYTLVNDKKLCLIISEKNTIKIQIIIFILVLLL